MSKERKLATSTDNKGTTLINPVLACENGYNNDEAVNAIKNKTMKAAVMSYRKAYESMEKGSWAAAKAAAKMKTEVRKEFGSDENLAHFLGLANKSVFNRLRRTGEFAEKAEKLGLSRSCVMELLVIEGDKYGNQNVENHLESIVDLTKDEVREYVAGFKKDKKSSKKDGKTNSKTNSKTPDTVADDKNVVEGDNIVESEKNVAPTEDFSLAVVWVKPEDWHSLDQKEKECLAEHLNELMAIYNVSSKVLS